MVCAGPGDPALHRPSASPVGAADSAAAAESAPAVPHRAPVAPGWEGTADPPAVAEFADALRAAISARGLSLERLRYHLARHGHDISVAALSYWQSGRSRPERASSLTALAALEEILQVPTDSLVALLPRRPGASHPQDRHEEKALESLARLGTPSDEGYSWISLYERLELDRAGALRRRSVRGVLQATRADVRGFPMLWRQALADDGGVEVQAVAGCAIGHVMELPNGVAVQVLFDRSPRPGEALVVDLDVISSGRGPRLTSWERPCSGTLRELYVEVDFDAAALPMVAERVLDVGGRQSVDLVPISGPLLTGLVQDFGPGVFGLQWRW